MDPTWRHTHTHIYINIQLTLVISNSMGPWIKFESTVVRLKEELWKYRKCNLFNDERETTRAKFWRAKSSIACPDSRNDFKFIQCFCCCFFSLLNSLNLVEWPITARYLFLYVYDYVYLFCCIDSMKCRRKLFSTENNANSEK
jgi:hypothetical protein